MPLLRLAQIALTASNAFFLLLVVFNNLTDYGSNYAFVENVLSMQTTFEGNAGMWRAIESPFVQHAFYWSIIAWEAAAMALIAWGSWVLWQARDASPAAFQRAKALAACGLVLSMLQWSIAFLSVGAEWFLMWQSDSWNGQGAAHRMFVVMGISLLFLLHRADEPEAKATA